MDINELKELIRLLEDSGLSEIEIEEDNRRVRLSKQWPSAGAMMHVPVAAHGPAPVSAAPAVSAPAAPVVEEGALPAGSHTIDSPMVGTFYAAASPGDPPFVLPGATVAADQTVCIVEAMKIMNEVASKEACVVEKVLVENGQPVEFGQPLFQVRSLG